jgi:hypothetical protein
MPLLLKDLKVTDAISISTAPRLFDCEDKPVASSTIVRQSRKEN